MKKVRFLVAMMLVVAALTVGVMAANEDYIKFETDTIECDGTNAITVNVVSPTGFSNGMVFFGIEFDTAKWDVTTSNSKAAVVDNMINYIDDAGSAEVAANGTILSFTATPKSTDVASTFELKEGQIVCLDPEAILADAATATLTVKAAQQKTPATVVPGTAEYKTYTGEKGQVYNNVWFNTYTATNNDQTINMIKLLFNGNEGVLDETKIGDGAGSYIFNVAIVGAKTTDTVNVDFTVAE